MIPMRMGLLVIVTHYTCDKQMSMSSPCVTVCTHTNEDSVKQQKQTPGVCACTRHWLDRIWFYSDLRGCLPAAMQRSALSRHWRQLNNNGRFSEASSGFHRSIWGSMWRQMETRQAWIKRENWYSLSLVCHWCDDVSEEGFTSGCPTALSYHLIVWNGLKMALFYQFISINNYLTDFSNSSSLS